MIYADPRAVSPARRFSVALRQAVHDAEHDHSPSIAGIQLVHYWDTDSLYWPAFGFLAEVRPDGRPGWPRGSHHRPHLERQATEDHLVSALFSAGLLGPVALISPHRAELQSLIARFAATRANDGVAYRQALTTFTRRYELDNVLNDVVKAAGSVNSAPGRHEAIARLNGIDWKNFTLIESLRGTWRQRTTNLLNMEETGLLHDPGIVPSMDEVQASRYLRPFWVALRDARRKRPKDVQTAIDATALAALAIMNERASRGQSSVFPRFHTASPTIWKIFREDAELQKALQFSYQHSKGTHADTVLRDSYTYILRAMFPSLSPPGAPTPGSDPGPSRIALRKLSNDLNEALETGEEELAHLVEETRIAGQRVTDLIASLESKAMGTIWLRYMQDAEGKVPKILSEVAAGLSAIHKLGTLEETRTLAFGFLEDTEKLLRTSFGDLALQVQIADRLTKAWPEKSHPDGMSLQLDFAAIRWGIGIGNTTDRTLSIEEGFFYSDVQKLRDDPQRAEETMAILLALKEYSLAVRLHEAISAKEAQSESMFIMGEAARVLFREERVDLTNLVETVMRRYAALCPDDASRLALGYGHVLFYAWRRMGFAASQVWGQDVPPLVLERWPWDPAHWASMSLEIVESATQDRGEAYHLYRINHLIYVSIVTRSNDTRDDLASQLESAIQVHKNPRFLDTVGYRRYLLALRSAPTTWESPAAEAWRSEHFERLHTAVELLMTALSLDPRNTTIHGHLERAQALLERVHAG